MTRLSIPVSLPKNLLVLSLALIVTPALADETLTINGKTASTTVRTLNGSTYVKLSDVAKALGMVVIKHPGGYEITKSGGANQVQAMTQGKIGDVLFDGWWRFQVRSVEMPDTYTAKFLDGTNSLHYDAATHMVRADARHKMVVVHCRMTNGQKSVQTFWIAPLPGERKINNALTDTDGESYSPDCFDLDGSISQSKPLLPGAKTDFVMLFSVPEATQLKDLVFTLQNNDSRPGNDVRVSLTP
ncbi:MAG: hypothetical protein ACRYFS_15775 [Janthinobacterium lividum]